jgi:hypothetical protein
MLFEDSDLSFMADYPIYIFHGFAQSLMANNDSTIPQISPLLLPFKSLD